MKIFGRVSRLLAKACSALEVSKRRRLGHTFTVTELLESRQLLAASGLQVVHRSGQSFVTWQEDTSVTGEGYHVYRSTSLITTANVGQAQKLTAKWGALDDNTSHHALTGVGAPANFVIQDLGSPLSDDQGLFVYTIQTGGAGNWYYAVTQVINGIENQTLTTGVNSLSNPVADTVATPQSILVSSINGGKGRVYTQFVDYANWNPTFEGYAYNYSVALPQNYDPNVAWPMRLMPHAYGERYRLESFSDFNWPVIEVFPDDAGAQSGFLNSWWYGFAADHNYKTNGAIPTSGHIENFTEQRLFQMMDQVKANFNVNSEAVHIQGHSMGASGALALGMRYGDYFAWTFSSEPMTNYAANPLFQGQFQSLWGTQASNLPIVNKGSHASRLAKYNGTGVYDWMNHQQMLGVMRNEPMAMLMVGHGKLDDVIDWQTQGLPIIAALNNARVAFTAENRGNWDHNWMGFDFVNESMFGDPNAYQANWVFRKDSSLIAFSNASGSGPLVPGPTGTSFYNLELDWSVPWNSFGSAIVDSADRYEVTLRSRAGTQTADVTPQKTASFKMTPGATVTWQNTNVTTTQVIQSGSVTADSTGLVTIPGVQVLTGSGNRLILNAGISTPVVQSPGRATLLQMPTITWTGSNNAASYDVWINNLSTGQNPVIQTNISATSFTPSNAMGIGRYRVWVRAKAAGGSSTAWSAPSDFQITTQVVIDTLPATFNDAIQFSWGVLPGAVKYDLWIDNLSTGQSQVVRQTALTTNSYQRPAGLPIGRYAFWVRGIDAGNTAAGWSVRSEFRVTTPVTIDSLPATFNDAILITWGVLQGASKYDLWIDNLTTGQSQVVRQTALTTNSYQIPGGLPLGKYNVWVRGIDAGNVAARWSGVRQFVATPRTIAISPATPGFNNLPVFQWQALAGASRYEIYVQNRATNAVVLNPKGITATNFTPSSPLPIGDYRWWAQASTSSGIVGAWSLQQDFNVGGKPIVLAPTGTSSNRTPTFSWTQVQGADHYELWVSKRDGTGVVINLTNVQSTSYTPTNSLDPREYRVWVRAVTSTSVFSSWSAYVDFTVTASGNPFDLVAPEDLSSILVSVLSQDVRQEQSKLKPMVETPGVPAESDAETAGDAHGDYAESKE